MEPSGIHSLTRHMLPVKTSQIPRKGTIWSCRRYFHVIASHRKDYQHHTIQDRLIKHEFDRAYLLDKVHVVHVDAQ
jgi:hypothetical protein